MRRTERDPALTSPAPGFYLDFELSLGSENAAASLENRPKHIELVSVRQESDATPALATVFVPDTAVDHFLAKLEAYRSENTKKDQAKNQNLIARIQNISLATVRSLYTDDPTMFPNGAEPIWWEVWVRQGQLEQLDSVVRHLDLLTQQQVLSFPDREVRLVYGDQLAMARLFLNSDSIAELRRAKDTPALFMNWNNSEQAAWVTDLADRIVPPPSRDVAVCLLDTGVTRAHPLLTAALDPNDVHAYDPTWPGGDQHGHGTNMAGTALYGDLTPLLAGNGPVTTTHCLESVKILPDQGANEPRLYGAITRECIARAEISAPDRHRATCMAVTSDIGVNRGRPSSWSAAIDQLCFGDPTVSRLILLSAGNIRDGVSKAGYPARNETESIENPAQAWNAITVGAYTEKTTIVDETYAGWEPVAPAGDICPTSRTSVTWEKAWPIKSEIVLEGGNWAFQGDQCDCPDDLGILTTHKNPTNRLANNRKIRIVRDHNNLAALFRILDARD